MRQLLDRFDFRIGPTTVAFVKINERRSSLVRTHHAIFVFSSYLRPTKDENRMVCSGPKKHESRARPAEAGLIDGECRVIARSALSQAAYS